MLPVEALVTPSQGGGGKIHATGGLSDLAKESVTNVSAVIKKLTGKDISDYDIHIQFVDTHGVDPMPTGLSMINHPFIREAVARGREVVSGRGWRFAAKPC